MSRPTRREIILIRRLDSLQRKYERRYEKLIYSAFKKQIAPYLEAIKDSPSNLDRYDLISPVPLARVLESLYVVAGSAYAELMYYEIQPPRKSLMKDLLRQRFRDFMRTYAIMKLPNTLTKIDDTSKSIIRKIVMSGLDEGLGALDVAKNLLKTIPQIFKNRSKLIARTEMAIATQNGAMQSSRSSDFVYEKRWIPAIDNRTREDHIAMANSEWIDMEKPFIVGGYEMMQPADPSAPPSQVCNCRCKVVFRIKRDVDGLPMRK